MITFEKMLNLIELMYNEIQELKIVVKEIKDSFQPKIPEEYLPTVEVAKIFHSDISTIYNWRKDGTLQAYGVKGKVYFKRSEVDRVPQPL